MTIIVEMIMMLTMRMLWTMAVTMIVKNPDDDEGGDDDGFEND